MNVILSLLFGIVVTSADGYFAERMYLSDLEPEGFRRAPVLFQISCTQSSSEEMDYQIRYSLYYGDKLLIDGESSPFTVSGGEEFVITSNDLGNPDSRFYITDYNIHDIAGGETAPFLARGILLPGEYRFEISFVRIPDYVVDTTVVFNFDILREDGIDPLSPGVPCGEPSSVVNERPLFLWLGDCDSFTLTVALFFNKNLSPENNLDAYPVLKKTGIKGNIFQFPFEYPPLDRGVYVWQLTGFKKTSSGIEAIRSIPLCFRVEPSSIQEIVEILKKKFGEDNVLIKKIEDEKLFPTGTIYVDGKIVTPEELKTLLFKGNVKNVRWK